MKRIICTLLIFGATQLGFAGTANAANPYGVSTAGTERFIDITDSHWAYEPVEEMVSRGIIIGYPDKTYKPDKPVTYGEFIKMASVICDGIDAGNSGGEIWSENYYEKLLTKRFYTSFDIPESKLNWLIPRGDIALIINGLLTEKGPENFDQAEKSIRDINSQTKHETEIIKAYEAGILTGYPDATFRPEGNLTRAEAATSLYRVIQQKAEKDIFSLIINMEEYRNDNWLDTGEYKELKPEEAGMTLRVPWNGRIAGFDHTMVGLMYLVKDNKIIEFCRSIPAETFITTASHFNLETIDYILCIPSKHGSQTCILIVKNPFKTEV